MKTICEEQLKARLRREHYSCEDPWYSCPRSDDGCLNEGEGTECNCGADNFNALLDDLLTGMKLVPADAVVLTQEQATGLVSYPIGLMEAELQAAIDLAKGEVKP